VQWEHGSLGQFNKLLVLIHRSNQPTTNQPTASQPVTASLEARLGSETTVWVSTTDQNSGQRAALNYVRNVRQIHNVRKPKLMKREERTVGTTQSRQTASAIVDVLSNSKRVDWILSQPRRVVLQAVHSTVSPTAWPSTPNLIPLSLLRNNHAIGA